MKAHALELITKIEDNSKKLNILREYLQALILRILYERRHFRSLAFVGGTALRLLYSLPRFSEDLDFSLYNKDKFDFESLLMGLKSDLQSMGYVIDVTFKAERTVNSAFIKFGELSYESGLSDQLGQKLSIKLEIDTKPPDGALNETKVLQVHFPVEVNCYNINSLFAGKCHALLVRQYTKGRDFFDLLWYLSKWNNLVPNLNMLINALKQTGYRGTLPDVNNWKALLKAKVEQVDWGIVEKDVGVFVERNNDLAIFSKFNVLKLLS